MLILVQRPQHKSISDSVGAPKKNSFAAILIEFGDTKKCYTFSGLELVPKSYLAVSAACTKAKNTSHSFWTIRKKLPLLETTKNSRYVQCLGKKNHFGPYTEAKKYVTRGQVRYTCSPEAQKKCKSLGAIRKKCLLCRNSAIFSAGGNFIFERGGVGPSKQCSFWCNGPSIKAPQIPLGHQKKSFCCYSYRGFRY